MTATLQIDDLHTLIDHHATSVELDSKDFGPAFGGAYATVALYQLIPIQQHPRPWIVRVEQHDEDTETIQDFDNQREAEQAYAREVDQIAAWYGDSDDKDEA